MSMVRSRRNRTPASSEAVIGCIAPLPFMQTTALPFLLDQTLATLMPLRQCCMSKVLSMGLCRDLPLSLFLCCRSIAHSTKKTGVASLLMEAVEMCCQLLSRVSPRYTAANLLMYGNYEMMFGLSAPKCKHSASDYMIKVVQTISTFPPFNPVNITFLFIRLQHWFSPIPSTKC